MSNTVKFLYGKKAKLLVRRKFTSTRSMLIERWLYEESDDRVKIYYIKNDDKEICSIALLSQMDFDPLGKQENPWCLDYIFTKPQYRRQGYGQKLASTIREFMQVSAHCSSKESMEMFLKAGYKPYFGSIHTHDDFTFLVRSE